MKIVTYNIRGDFGIDGNNNFSFRKPLILEKIRRELPDVIGFQEVLPHVQTWLREELTGYTVVGRPRCQPEDDEAMTIAVRNETTELLGLEVFWLSPQPHVPGSRYAIQSMCPRTCAMAILRNRELSVPIRLYNTHLDHEGVQARMAGLRQILRQMEQDAAHEALPIVLMGDFNCTPDAAELAQLAEFPSLGLTDRTDALPLTFHGYFREGAHPGKIDYIFATPELRTQNTVCWDDVTDGVYLSDHYPICTEVTLA